MATTTTPQEVLDAIEKLDSSSDQNTIKDYVFELQSTIDQMKSKLEGEVGEEEEAAGAEAEEADDVKEEEESEPEFPPLYSSGDDFEKAADHKQQAADFKSQSKYEEALEQYTLAVLAAEPSPLLYANRALCLLKLDRPKAAVRDCNEALKINPDSAKALRTRGKAYMVLEKYVESRHDLSEAQQIDFDEGTVDDLKLVSEKVAEQDKERVQAKLKQEEKLKKRAEEIKLAQEEAKREAAASSSPSSSGTGMPGGMPGGGMPGGSMPGGSMPGGMGGLMNVLMSDPEIAEALQNPKVMAAFSSLMSNPAELMSNPGKMQELMQDPEVGPVLQKIMAKLGPGMAGGMGGAGGMPGATAGGDDDDLDDLPDLEENDDMPELD